MKKTITTYLPENHGLTTGSNNGNYREDACFKNQDGKHYLKITTSGDGDIFPHAEWQEVTPEHFTAAIKAAVVASLNDYRGDNIWEEVVHHIDQHGSLVDWEATEAADPGGRSDIIVLQDGGKIEWNGREWV